MISNLTYSPETINSGQNWRIFARVILKFDGWPWKTIGHLLYAPSGFVYHFAAICELKLELRCGNAPKMGQNFVDLCDLNLWFLTLIFLHGHHFVSGLTNMSPVHNDVIRWKHFARYQVKANPRLRSAPPWRSGPAWRYARTPNQVWCPRYHQPALTYLWCHFKNIILIG